MIMEKTETNVNINNPEINPVIKNPDYFSGLKKMYPKKNDSTVEFFALIIALAFTLIIVALISYIPVDTNTDKYVGVLLSDLLADCSPEPLEMPMFALSVLMIPSVFLVSYSVLKKKLKPVPIVLTNSMQLFFLAVVCVASGFAFWYSAVEVVHIMDDFNLAVFILLPLTAAILFLLIFTRRIKKTAPQKIIFFAVLAVVFAYAMWRFATMNYSRLYSSYNNHHYYAIWYPIAKVNDGQTIGVDFKSIYGFYPYIAIPILKLFGGVNQTSSAIFITLLLAIVAFSFCAVSYKFIKNKILALIVSVAAVLYGPFSILGDRSTGGIKMYLQYNPLRSVCIATALIAILIRSSIKSKRLGLISDIVICVVLGFGLAWNFETGAIAVIIWSAYRVFRAALENKLFNKKTYIEFAKTVAYAFGSFAVCFAFVTVITFIRSGQLLQFGEMFFGLTAFAGTGYFMLKITFGLWMAAALIFSISLLRTLPYLTKYKNASDEVKRNITGLFIASIAGVGMFAQFIGRSYDTVALFSFPCALICCALLYENILNSYEDPDFDKTTSSKILSWSKRIICVGFISMMLIAGVANLVYSFSSEFKEFHYPNKKALAELNLRETQIKEWADKNNNGKIPNNLLNYSVFTNEQLGKKSYEKVCEQVDWFYIDNARTYLDYINSHPDEIFMINRDARDTLKFDLSKEYKKTFKKFKRVALLKGELMDNVYIYAPKKSGGK